MSGAHLHNFTKAFRRILFCNAVLFNVAIIDNEDISDVRNDKDVNSEHRDFITSVPARHTSLRQRILQTLEVLAYVTLIATCTFF